MPKYNSDDNTDLYPKLSESYYWEFDPPEGDDGEDEDKHWYYLIQVGEKDYHITNAGMSIDFEDGSVIMTNVTPIGVFPDAKEKLTEDQLFHLINFPIEGGEHSPADMDTLYQKWISLGRP